jgi:hypothetical protein
MGGHFYADSAPSFIDPDPEYVRRIKLTAGDLDMVVILPTKSKSSSFKSTSFEKYFNFSETYHENHEIVNEEYLLMMREAANKQQIFM